MPLLLSEVYRHIDSKMIEIVSPQKVARYTTYEQIKEYYDREVVRIQPSFDNYFGCFIRIYLK